VPFDLSSGAPQRIAIVGGGISGLASAWLLSRHHEVTLYEAEPRLGGHARTVLAGRNRDRAVDTGFIVFNYANYPHLTRMFLDLNVPVERSDMSFGVTLDQGRLEYGLQTAGSVFGQRSNLLRPSFISMLRDIVRFNARAEAAVASRPQETIGDLLSRLGLGRAFRDHYLYPICGAIWSTAPAGVDGFPAQNLVRFMRNHALLSSAGQHPWWTVSGGSITYVRRLHRALAEAGVQVRTASPVTAVRREGSLVQVLSRGDLPRIFDQVVLACHADMALDLLETPTAAERRALGAIRFQSNRAVLHRDPSVMPRRRPCWSSWVYQGSSDGLAEHRIGVSYWMNRLQNIDASDPLFVTLNPAHDIDEASIYDETTFRHPQFDAAALAAQGSISAMQGLNRTWFAGAWQRNGFHEDGFASAARIARRLSPMRVLP
jgi:predicted NAD/FAD-binding protein